MNILRKVKKSVDAYSKLLITNPQKARTYCLEYLSDIDSLQSMLEMHLDSTSIKFQKWCYLIVEVFESKDTNVFLHILRNIKMSIINHFLNKYSYELSLNDILQNSLKQVKEKLIQFKYLC